MDADKQPNQLELFIDLFDEIMNSEDVAVRRAFDHLMLIATLSRSHSEKDLVRDAGPLRAMHQQLRALQDEMRLAQSILSQLQMQISRPPQIGQHHIHPQTWTSTNTGIANWDRYTSTMMASGVGMDLDHYKDLKSCISKLNINNASDDETNIK